MNGIKSKVDMTGNGPGMDLSLTIKSKDFLSRTRYHESMSCPKTGVSYIDCLETGIYLLYRLLAHPVCVCPAQPMPWLSQLSLSVGQTAHIVYTQQHYNKSMLTHSSG